MAFMGVLFLSGIVMIIFFIIVALFLFVFVPCVIIAIINLVKGIKNHWPKRNLIPFIITTSISSIFILLIIIACISKAADGQTSSSASSAIQSANLLLISLGL